MLSECRIEELLDYASAYGEFDENTPTGTKSSISSPMDEERRGAIRVYKRVLQIKTEKETT